MSKKMNDCGCGDREWGMRVFYEMEPWGDTFVDCPKGLEPCGCWRGSVVATRKKMVFAIENTKRFFSKKSLNIDENDIPF